MKTIGIVAATAEGAALCYRTIVEMAGKQLGPNVHPKILLANTSFADILEPQNLRDWSAVAKVLTDDVNLLAQIGADFAIMPVNAVHYAYPKIAESAQIPVLNLVDIVADECQARGFKKAAVLGVGMTMSDGLYDSALRQRGIEPIVPNADSQKQLSRIIYDELVLGKIVSESTDWIVGLLEKLKHQGCDGVALACTELPLVINENNSPLPFIDTTRLLAKRALQVATSQRMTRTVADLPGLIGCAVFLLQKSATIANARSMYAGKN